MLFNNSELEITGAFYPDSSIPQICLVIFINFAIINFDENQILNNEGKFLFRQ